MLKRMIFVLCLCLATSFTACSPRESARERESESAVTPEKEISISEKSEPDGTATDGISYPTENTEFSIEASFGNELLYAYNNELVSVLNQWLDAHRNGTFEETPNHHPAYPSDFPPVTQLPVIDSVKDIIVAWRESVMLDAYIEKEGRVFIVVPIDQSHIYILEPAKVSDADDNITIGFAYSGFHAMSIDEFISQREIDFWHGGE